MTVSDPKLKRAHHTVPRFHLERFARPPGPGRAHAQLTRVELPGTKRHPISVTSATVERDFYLMRTTEGDLTDAFEDQLSEVEGAAAAAVRDLVDKGAWPLTDENREPIAAWAALQHLRTPGEREMLAVATELASEITSRGLRAELPGLAGAGPHTYVRQRELSREDRDQLREIHLQGMVRSFRSAVATLLGCAWTVVRFQRKSLITSDTPVTLIPIADADIRTPLSLASNDGILVPLDRRVALLMVDGTGDDRMIAGTTQASKSLNQEIVNGARRCVFHHPDDDPLAGLVLPEPAQAQLMFERMV
ncbi:uncharacterized protein DUF4238 [Lentzea atacamensis]|uniref:Uncharacterized protein DUF4238 n=1 Tax=Lentzea atacamensis TaxID=531938 RepID=A0ABX9DVW0_9PSEU|nr:DUF4238 domain-containing protein [Lentzea atacamensis]RAS59430.1 uncharacterized protein DUF4238 [Lentzea atacamensis]